MRRLRARLGWLGLSLALAVTGARAEARPSPCSGRASVSPCFSADPLWIPSGPTPFAAVESARVLPERALSLSLAGDVSHRPVVLVTPSPHPDGQELDVVRATSRLALGARYGLGRGLDAGIALPFVPYQLGTGTAPVTEQRGEALPAVALGDPRLGFAATLAGRDAQAPLALATHLELGLPLGSTRALAGSGWLTVAPGFSGELALARLHLGAELGARLTRAVSLATVREGSSLFAALAVSFTLLDAPELAVGAEAWLAPHLTREPAGSAAALLDLPAEWLATLRCVPARDWSVLVGGGSGLPFSRTREPGGARESALAVTSPDVRVLALARYTLPRAW